MILKRSEHEPDRDQHANTSSSGIVLFIFLSVGFIYLDLFV